MPDATAILLATATGAVLIPSPTVVDFVIATASAIADSSYSKGPHDPPPNGECRLLGPFALLVQGALGACALLALVFKRWRERPQRPLKIWSFDVSKQVVGSVLVHVANLLMSMLSSGQFSVKITPGDGGFGGPPGRENGDDGPGNSDMGWGPRRRMEDAFGNYQPNPCSFYLLNLAIDTTIGIPILILLLRLLTALFSLTPLGNPAESIRSGHYGSPPRAMWWFKQCIIYFLGLLGMKICVLIIFLALPWISRVGDWALRWTEGNEELQVFFVMMFFPLIMNATQYYIIDTFIKNQKPDEISHEAIPQEDDEDFVNERNASSDGSIGGDYEGSQRADEDDVELKGEGKAVQAKNNFSRRREGLRGEHSYDELFDGESGSTVVGSGSTSGRRKLMDDDSEDENETKGLSRS